MKEKSFRNPLKWMKFDPEVVGLETDHLTIPERGAYFTIMRHLWVNGPMSETRLRATLRDHFEAVMTCLSPFGDGFSMAWMEEARTEGSKVSDRQREIAEKGWEKRRASALRSHSHGNATASHGMPRHSHGNATAMQKEKEREKENTPQSPLPAVGEDHTLSWPGWAGEKTKAKWEEFKQYRKSLDRFKYKTSASEQAAINTLAKYFTNGQQTVAALDEAMAKGWKFPVDPSAKSNGFASASKFPDPASVPYRNFTGYSTGEPVYKGTPQSILEAYRKDFREDHDRYPTISDNPPAGYAEYAGWI
jgi:uncharacterized protein YdaU (DUF1376 family)